MLFTLIKKVAVVQVGKEEKKFTNFYIVNKESGISLPIEIKAFKKDEKLINRGDFAIASKVALYEKTSKENN